MALKIVRLGGGGGGSDGQQPPRPPSSQTSATSQTSQSSQTSQTSQTSSQEGPPVEEPRVAESDVPSLTGPLGGPYGGKLLMELFVGERSGRLVVEGMPGPVGTLYFLAGEPVHAPIADGGAAIERRLEALGALKPPGTVKRHSRARSPLGALARRSNPVVVLEALRDEVRDFCRQLLAARAGAWAFFDGTRFADSTPLTAVNTFGLFLEQRRRAADPQALFRLAEQIGPMFLEPSAGFANASARLRSFTGQVDIADLVDGTRSAADVIKQVGLDPIVGSLVLGCLVDTGLMRLSPMARSSSARDHRKQSTSTAPALVQADARRLSELTAGPSRGGAEILGLYLEIKPEEDPDVVLGIEGSVGPAMIERCYQQRLAELDPRAIPPGPNRPYLLARVEELRAKVERAYWARTGARARGASAYEIFDRIGVGGMAEVFLGRATDEPDKLVAIKVILPDLRADQSFSEMFLEEARLARRIQHPNVVRVLTVGKSTDDLYLAMEYVDGLDFGDLVKRGREQGKPATVDLTMRVVAEASAGLHAAHTACDRSGNPTPILHRDVSPQNILVSRMGDVKLSDFGIAKANDTHEENQGGTVKGKIPYLAPELLRGKPASVHSDVYAMAMTVYGALTKLPFQRGDSHSTMYAILHERLPPLSSLVPDVPPRLDALLARAAAKNPEERHASAQELQLELEEILATRPAVDVAGWARALAGRRGSAGGAPGVITSKSNPRLITSKSNPRPITSTHARPLTSPSLRAPTTSTSTKMPAAPGSSGSQPSFPAPPKTQPPTQAPPSTSPMAAPQTKTGIVPAPVVSGAGGPVLAPDKVPQRILNVGEEDIDVDDF